MRRIAPVHAIRGNVDHGVWAGEFSPTEIVEVDGQSLYVLHDLHTLDLDPSAAGFRVVISGHTHNPAAGEQRGVVYLNPGSAGPRRFRLPISLARMTIGQDDGEDRGLAASRTIRSVAFGAGPAGGHRTDFVGVGPSSRPRQLSIVVQASRLRFYGQAGRLHHN